MKRLCVLVAGVLPLLMAAQVQAVPGAAPHAARAVSLMSAPPSLRVHDCQDLRNVRCGAIEVPRYWSRPADPATDLTVKFRIYGHTDRSAVALEPLVGFEGGPGYGSIGSASSYLAMMGPLRARHDLIVMDQRGTGASGAIDCPALQRGVGVYVNLVAACARTLGAAANAYGSAAAADDLHAILRGLGIPKVDLYGDSYGTYLAQVFALHHPSDVRAMVLDGAYDQSFDPFARDASGAIRRAWRALCARDRTCPHVLRTIGRFAAHLAAHPLTLTAPGAGRPVRLTEGGLAQMVYDAAYVFTIYRDLPAAIHAAERGDKAPLRRLTTEDLASTGNGSDPRAYSAGLYMAVSCHDYPTVWNARAGVPERKAQLVRAIAGLAPSSFAPFEKDAYLHSLYEEQLVYGCLKWPAPSLPDPAFPVDQKRSDIPTLVLDGELDVTTPLVNAQHVADAWPNATLVEVRNEVHISALYDFEHCASVLAQRFIRTTEAGNTSCASQIPDVYVVPSFPVHLRQAPQAVAGAGDRSTAPDRRAAWVAAQTVGDAFTRWYDILFGGTGSGLRGGTFRMRGPYRSHLPLTIKFRRTRLVNDLAVSGPAVWNRRSYRLNATLRLRGSVSGRLTISFPTQHPGGPATIHGVLDGRHVVTHMPAPWKAP